MSRGTDTPFELTTIERLEHLGCGHRSGPDPARARAEVVLSDVVAERGAAVYDEGVLRDLIHDVGQTVRKNLKVDRTEPHCAAEFAEIRASVKSVLRKHGVTQQDLEPFCERPIAQATALFRHWPLAV